MRGRLLLLAVLAFPLGCGPPPPPLFDDFAARDTSEHPRWPSPPAEARVRYLGEIRGEAVLVRWSEVPTATPSARLISSMVGSTT